MSFTQKVKAEILLNNLKNKCCKTAFLSGVLHSAGSLSFDKNGINFSASSENNKLIQAVFDIIQSIYNTQCQILVETTNTLNKKTLYTLLCNSKIAKNILLDARIISYVDELLDIKYGIDKELFKKQCCEKYFIMGLFLGCGTVYVPENDGANNSYRLEFSLNYESMADDLIILLEKYNFLPKKAGRKNNYVLYFKESEQICDLLTFLGANAQVLYINSIMVDRLMRNKINRQSNCINANIDKTVMASAEQVEAIKYIDETIGLDKLDDKLREIAKIRLLYKEESISELSEHMKSPIGKSGISHRLRKLINIADNLKGGNTNGF